MQFGMLGNLEARRDGELVYLGPHRQRSLLALLSTAPNTVFSTDQIIHDLWVDEAAGSQNSLWVAVSGLRKRLEPERARRTEGTILHWMLDWVERVKPIEEILTGIEAARRARADSSG